MSKLLSAKRSKNERRGMHAWHPYYAGYSENFVSSAIQYLNLGPSKLVLDPWAGSGTTNIVCSRLGVESIGLDVNPAMAIFAAAKSPENVRSAEKIKSFLSGLSALRPATAKLAESDPLLEMFDHDSARGLRSIIGSIDGDLFVPSPLRSENGASDIDCAVAFAHASIFVTVRAMLGLAKNSNPTWSKFFDEKQHLSFPTLVEAVQRTGTDMFRTLEGFYGNADGAKFHVRNEDCKRNSLPSDSVDGVITSPPYLTRIDYAVSTQIEISLLLGRLAVNEVRHRTMGAPVITSNPKQVQSAWGHICNDLLNRIQAHHTKAAATYYWKNVVQYFQDAETALREIFRVMKSGSRGLVVVQSSYFKEIEMPLGEIYVEMANNLGFSAKIAFREEVRGHMAHVNTKSNQYMPNKVYFEDFVLIEK